MKSILVRSFALAALATSISAFAASDGEKTAKNSNANDTKFGVPTAASTVARQKSGQDKDPDPCCLCSSGPAEQKIREQEKQWLHDLQGIFG